MCSFSRHPWNDCEPYTWSAKPTGPCPDGRPPKNYNVPLSNANRAGAFALGEALLREGPTWGDPRYWRLRRRNDAKHPYGVEVLRAASAAKPPSLTRDLATFQQP